MTPTLFPKMMIFTTRSGSGHTTKALGAAFFSKLLPTIKKRQKKTLGGIVYSSQTNLDSIAL